MPFDLDPNLLPKFSTTPSSASASKPNPILGGLASGFHELLGIGGSAVAGVGKLEGFQNPVGEDFAANQNATAARVGRPDLEIAPWQQGGASVAPWLAYQASKMVPTLAGYVAATALTPEAAVPAGLARLGATLPEWLGGGAAAATPELAQAAGKSLAKFVVGGGTFGGVTGFGQAINSADQKAGGATQSDAFQALAESPLYAAAGLVGPEAFLRGGVGRVVSKVLGDASGNVGARIAGKVAAGGALAAVQSGVLTGLDQTFRPDLSTSDKMSNIVDATLAAAPIGGLFGAVHSGPVHDLKRADPNQIDTGSLSSAIDQELNLGDASQAQNIGRVALPAPTAFTDASGRTVVGSGGDEVLRGTPAESAQPSPVEIPQAPPALIAPTDVSDRGAVPGSTIVVGRRDDTGKFTNAATGVEQPPVVPDDLSRTYRNKTDAELFSAANALANKHEAEGGLPPALRDQAQAMAAEIEFRKQARNDTLTPGVVQPTTEAVEQPSNLGGTGESKAAPASPIQARIDELTEGLRLPATLKEKLANARSEDDIQNIVHDEVIVDGKSGKMRDTLAQRVGMLDSEGKPTAMADEVSARKTAPGEQPPTPGADAAFQDQWKQDIQQAGSKDPAVQALKPTSTADAQLQIYRALGDQGVKSDADGLEKIAQKYGVLDENKQLTPTALQLAARDPISTEDSANAAIAQGYKGAATSMFDRGVRAQLGEGEALTKFDSSKQGEAYQAGMKWAEETNSVPKGALKKYEPTAYTGEITDEQRALGQQAEVKKGEIPPEVRQGQLVNEAIDNAGLHPTKDESDVAQLKSMVRNGDINGAMEGLRRVQRGESLFNEPARGPAEPFKGEQVLPGAPKLEKSAELVPTKGASRAQAEQAIKRYEIAQRLAGSPEKQVADAATRAARRAQLHADLQEALAQHQRESEVPELNVDAQGRLSPVASDTGRPLLSNEDRIKGSAIVSHAIDHPDDVKGLLNTIAAQGGDLGKIAERFAKHVPDDTHLRVLLSSEMREVGRQQGWARTPLGFYDHGSQTVFLSTFEQHPAVAMHEIAHAIIGEAIYDHTPAGRQIEAAFNRLKPYLPKGDYSTTNANEFIAEFLARQQVRDWVRDISDQHPDARGNIFQRIWNGIRSALGMPAKDQVERLLQLAEQAAGERAAPSRLAASPMLMKAPEYSDKVHDSVKGVVDRVSEKLKEADPLGEGRKTLLKWGGENTAAAKFGKFFDYAKGNGLLDHIKANDQRGPMSNLFSRPVNEVYDGMRALKRTDPKAYETLNHLVQITADGINPGADWEHQSDTVKENPLNKPFVAKAGELLRSLQTKDTQTKTTMRVDAFNNLREASSIEMLRQLADQVHKVVTSNVLSADALPGFEVHPADKLMERSTRETFTPLQTRQFWQNELLGQLKAVDDFITTNKTIAEHPATDKAEAERITRNIDDLKSTSGAAHQMLNRLASGPNFHLGRTGDYFVDMKLKTDEDGNVDRKALKAASKHLEQFGVVVPLNASADHVFLRVENLSAQNDLYAKAKELQSKGIVRADGDQPSILAGKRGDERISRAIAPWMARFEAAINARTNLSDESKEMLIKELRSNALDAANDSNIAKFMAPREYIPGFNADMIDSFLTRAKASNDAMVGRVVAPKISDAYAKMEEARDLANKADAKDVPLQQRQAMTDVINEWRQRDAGRVNYSQTPFVDAMRRVANFFALGGTVAYPVVQFSQLPMVALPKLGSKFGFVKAARTMGEVTPQAFKIMAAVFKTGTEVSGLNWVQKGARAANVEVSLEALRKAGVNAKTSEYLMHLVNAGQLGTGSQAHILSAASDGRTDGAFNHTLQYAAGMGYYAETLTRVITALAHAKLNPELSARDAAVGGVQLLKDSLFDFHMDAQGRAFGKNGVFGNKTPLMTQFMTYQSQLVQRLYLEMHNAFKGDRQAQAFLLQHAAMVTAFAGTLGLPFATYGAIAYDKLKELIDPDGGPSDIKTDYRNFLANMFGKDVGELIAKGPIPRAAGVDLTNRVGEQDIGPFSRFLSDRRNLKDQFKDLEARSWGAPANMVVNAMQGAGKLADGDVMGGLSAMMPAVVANPVKAYQMTEKGYTDSNGQQLPIATPKSTAILAQLLGFTPAQKAEYSDARMAQSQRQGILQRQSTQLRSQIVDAMISKDHDTARQLISQAAEFDRKNPAYPVLSGIEGAIMRRQQNQELSQRFGTPLGVSPKDLPARQLSHFANIEFAAHSQ